MSGWLALITVGTEIIGSILGIVDFLRCRCATLLVIMAAIVSQRGLVL